MISLKRLRAQIGDRRAKSASADERQSTFARLSQLRLNRAYRMAASLLRDLDEAQDAVHDAAVQAWARWASLRDPDKFDAWFDRIVVNCCRDRMRRRASRRRLAVLTVTAAMLDPTGDAGQIDALRQSLDALTAGHRLVIVLRYLDDLSVQEIARLTGLREGTVKSRLHYGLRDLRAAYDAADRE
jgi:RNA polymerase sigma-70 factor (ECF subfamily)